MLSWSSFNKYSEQHNILFKPLAAFPHSHCWNNVQRWEEWVLLQWLSSNLGKNIGRAGDRTSDLLFSSSQCYPLSYGVWLERMENNLGKEGNPGHPFLAFVIVCCPSSVRPFSLNIFFSETTYRILMKFHRNVPAMVLFRISWKNLIPSKLWLPWQQNWKNIENFENLLVRNHKG